MNHFWPGSVNTHWGLGQVNTNLVPGSVNTSLEPEPEAGSQGQDRGPENTNTR